jgi:hypothetical protein
MPCAPRLHGADQCDHARLVTGDPQRELAVAPDRPVAVEHGHLRDGGALVHHHGAVGQDRDAGLAVRAVGAVEPRGAEEVVDRPGRQLAQRATEHLVDRLADGVGDAARDAAGGVVDGVHDAADGTGDRVDGAGERVGQRAGDLVGGLRWIRQ